MKSTIKMALVLTSIFAFCQSSLGQVAVSPATKSALQENIDSLTVDEVTTAIGEFGGDAAVELSNVVKTIFAKSGQPSALILGDEIQGSFIIGYRKGSGTIVYHGVKSDQAPKIKWSAPSIGINVGATASKVAILVYGAESIEDLKQKFVSLQGSYHLIGGAAVSYMTNPQRAENSKKITLAYVSVGVGLDAGVAVESLSFR